MNQLIPIAEGLFVLNQWTLMMDSGYSDALDEVKKIRLFDESRSEIEMAKAVKFLPSKKPEIFPVEIELLTDLEEVKRIKFIYLD